MACVENEVDVGFDPDSRNDLFRQGQQLYSASMKHNAFVDGLNEIKMWTE